MLLTHKLQDIDHKVFILYMVTSPKNNCRFTLGCTFILKELTLKSKSIALRAENYALNERKIQIYSIIQQHRQVGKYNGFTRPNYHCKYIHIQNLCSCMRAIYAKTRTSQGKLIFYNALYF